MGDESTVASTVAHGSLTSWYLARLAQRNKMFGWGRDRDAVGMLLEELGYILTPLEAE